MEEVVGGGGRASIEVPEAVEEQRGEGELSLIGCIPSILKYGSLAGTVAPFGLGLDPMLWCS